MKNVSDKIFRDNQNMHFMFNNFFSKTCAIFEIMWKNMVESDKPQMTISFSALHARKVRLQRHTQGI